MPVIYQNLQSKCIEIIQLAFMCTICNRVQRVLHLGANKFAPPREEEQIRKTPFTWPNIHPGCKFTPRVQIFAHERGFKARSPHLTLNLMVGLNGVAYANVVEGATDTARYLIFFMRLETW